MTESPLASIEACFIQAQGGTEPFSLPKDVKKAVAAFVTGSNRFTAEEIGGLISAIDTDDLPLERLDAPGTVILCSIFLHADSCLPVQRGIYLLATGVLELELLTKCPANTRYFETAPAEIFRSLGSVVTQSQNRVIRQLAGSIIRQLVLSGILLEAFFGEDTQKDVLARFPTDSQRDSQWVVSFESFVQELLPNDDDLSQRSELPTAFATAISLGETCFTVKEEAAILVTASDALNIVIPASADRPSTYIDVPFGSIQSVGADQLQQSISQEDHALQLDLDTATRPTIFVNAKGENAACILLGFSSQSAASAVKQCVSMKLDDQTPFVVGVSEALDISDVHNEDVVDYLNEPEVQQTARTQVLGHSTSTLQSQNNQKRTSSGKFEDRQRPQQYLPDMFGGDGWPKLDKTGAAHEPARVESRLPRSSQVRNIEHTRETESAIISPGNRASVTTRRKRSSRTDIEQHEGVQDYVDAEHTSENGLSSQIAWQQGMEVIETAPEFQVKAGSAVASMPLPKEGSLPPGFTHHVPSRSSAPSKGNPGQSNGALLPRVRTARSALDAMDDNIHGRTNGPVVSEQPNESINRETPLKGTKTSSELNASDGGGQSSSALRMKAASQQQPKEKTKAMYVGTGERVGPSKDLSANGGTKSVNGPAASVVDGAKKHEPSRKLRVEKRNTNVRLSNPVVNKLGKELPSNLAAAQSAKGNASTTNQAKKEIHGSLAAQTSRQKPPQRELDDDLWSEGLLPQEDEMIVKQPGKSAKSRTRKAKKASSKAYPSPSPLSTMKAQSKVLKTGKSAKIEKSKPPKRNTAAVAASRSHPKGPAAVKTNRRIGNQLSSEDNPYSLEADKFNKGSNIEEAKKAQLPNADSSPQPEAGASTPIPKKISATKQSHVTDETRETDSTEQQKYDHSGVDASIALAGEIEDDAPQAHQEESIEKPTVFNSATQHKAVDRQERELELPSPRPRLGIPQDVDGKHSGVKQGFLLERNTRQDQAQLNHQAKDFIRLEIPQSPPKPITVEQGTPFSSAKAVADRETTRMPIAPKRRAADPFATKLGPINTNRTEFTSVGTARSQGKLVDRIKPLKAASLEVHGKAGLTTGRDGNTSLQDMGKEVQTPVPDKRKRRSEVAPMSRLHKKQKREAGSDAQRKTQRRTDRQPKSTSRPLSTGKANIIHFSTSGPQNQGKIARSGHAENTDSHLVRLENPIQLEDTFDPDVVPVDRNERQFTKPKVSKSPTSAPGGIQKSELQKQPESHNQQHISGPSDPALPFSDKTKRQQIPTLIEKPVVRHPKQKPEVRFGSQTHVTDDGSPILLSQRHLHASKYENTILEDQDAENALADAKLDEGTVPSLHESPHVAVVTNVVHQPAAFEAHSSGASRAHSHKQVPSSPTAESTFAHAQEFSVHPNGVTVNVQTSERLEPTELQDPFVANAQVSQSSFMSRLRKAVKDTAVNAPEVGVPSREVEQLKRPTNPPAEDPDKTLVASVTPKHRARPVKGRKEIIDVSSYGSSYSSSVEKPVSAAVEEESVMDTGESFEWAEDHHYEMHSLLCGIVGRLSQRIIKREEVIHQKVQDFGVGGKALIDDFVEDRTRSMKRSAEAARQTQIDLLKFYKHSITSLDKLAEARTDSIRREWEATQGTLNERMNEALAACQT